MGNKRTRKASVEQELIAILRKELKALWRLQGAYRRALAAERNQTKKLTQDLAAAHEQVVLSAHENARLQREIASFEHRSGISEKAQPGATPHGVLGELAAGVNACTAAVEKHAKAIGARGAVITFALTTATVVFLHWEKMHFILQLLWLLFHVVMVVLFGHSAGGMECLRAAVKDLRRRWRERSARVLDCSRPLSAPLCTNVAVSTC